MSEDCFACGRKLGKSPQLVDTRDDQTVYVGRECYRLIKAAGSNGYQSPLGGPRLFLLPTIEKPATTKRVREGGRECESRKPVIGSL